MWSGSRTHHQACDWSFPCVRHWHTQYPTVLSDPIPLALTVWQLHPILKEHKSDETNFAVFTAEPFPLDTLFFLWNTWREFLLSLKGIREKLWSSGSLWLWNAFCRIYHPACLAVLCLLIKLVLTAWDGLDLFHGLSPNMHFSHQTQPGHPFSG